jgi:hypothetical protein
MMSKTLGKISWPLYCVPDALHSFWMVALLFCTLPNHVVRVLLHLSPTLKLSDSSKQLTSGANK